MTVTPVAQTPSPLADAIAQSDLSAAPPTPELAEIIDGMKAGGDAEAIRLELIPIARAVDKLVNEGASTVATAFANLEQVGVLRRLGPSSAVACATYVASHNAMASNPNLSITGRLAEDAAFAATRTAELDRIEAIRVDYSNRLLKLYPAAVFPVPAADLVPEVQLIYLSAPAKTPLTFARESLAALSRAVNPADGNQKLRDTQLLFHAYLPLNRRRADAPPRFAAAYAGVSGALADVMQAYLDHYLQAANHRMAVGFVSMVETQLAAVNAIGIQSGADRYLLEISGPVFDWTAGASSGSR